MRLLIVSTAALFIGLAVAGCLTPDEGGTTEELVFSDTRGPGATDPLIPLTDDPVEDAQAILDACDDHDDRVGCATEHLEAVLAAAGSIYAFDVLHEMTELDHAIERGSHPIAHVLGNKALYVYGTIGNALTNCSHKVFQGCIHGALEEFFRHVDTLDGDVIRGACPDQGTSFERYACNHGLGHGLVLATDYDLAEALDLCATLATSHSQASCNGGAFMENVVAFKDHERMMAAQDDKDEDDPHAHHDHHGGGTPEFWVDPDDLEYPCNAIDEAYQVDCWGMQTSLVLYFNSGDFEATARICDQLETAQMERCYRSLGRDISSHTARDPALGSLHCSTASDDATRALCVRGFIATAVTRFADPEAGLPLCEGFDEQDKPACYEHLARTGRSMVTPEELEAVCAQAESSYIEDCRRGGRL